jgi:eukaryotic-like serine/threonine-protein kinase
MRRRETGATLAKTIHGPSALAQHQATGTGAGPGDTIRDAGASPSESSSPREPSTLVGTVFQGKYELVKPLAAGAMGTVYEARHLALQRRFAVKVLSIDSAQQADALPRFKREAELASAIGHPNIVDIVDIDRTQDDQWYIVMELLQGQELRERMFRARRLPLDEVVSIARQLGSAVDAAHAQGIVHRDLKPENIFVLDSKDPEAEITVKIVDFGISKVRNADTALTRPGEVIGTPFYMSPEQARGDRTIDHRADLFALGAVFYEALTGTAPFQGATPNAVLRSILLDDLPPPKEMNSDLSDAVCRVLEKALAKDPDERFQTGAQLAEALARAARGDEGDEEAEPEAARDEGAAAGTPAAPAPATSRSGFQGIHLILAFIAGAVVCAAIVLAVLFFAR